MSFFKHIFSHLQANSDLPPNFLNLLPRSYKRVGHVAIINLHESLLDYKYIVGEAILLYLSGSIKTIARFTRPIEGIKRKPDIEILAGDPNLDTVHTEHGTKFFLNPSLVMLSAGNHSERKRIFEFVRELGDEDIYILDMFACVGNLSLPLAKNCKNTLIIALEINNQAAEFLKQSIRINKIQEERYKIIIGDNRETTPHNYAQIVIMGYFRIDKQQLQCAIESLNSDKDQCWLMIHDTGNINSDSSVMIMFNELIASNDEWKIKTIEKHFIKSIGPSLEHWVFDCCLSKSKR